MKNNMSKKEKAPKKNKEKAVWDFVVKDMKERDKVGKERYGVRLQPFNGRNSLKDGYQEGLDLVVYLRQAIIEREEMISVLNYYATLHAFKGAFEASENENKAAKLLIKLGELDE